MGWCVGPRDRLPPLFRKLGEIIDQPPLLALLTRTARTLPKMAAPLAMLALLAAASGPPISNLSTTAFHSTSINVSP